MEKKTKEEILDQCGIGGYHYEYRTQILRAMDLYAAQFKVQSCDAMGHYGGEKPEGICPKCGKPWKSPEAARHHQSPVDSLKNFDVLLRAYMDRKLHEAGVRMPNEFWETIQKDEAIEYLKIPISEHPSSLTGEQCGTCGGCMIQIRGRYPKEDKRLVCPTCNTERLEQINEISSKHYGVACKSNTPVQIIENKK